MHLIKISYNEWNSITSVEWREKKIFSLRLPQEAASRATRVIKILHNKGKMDKIPIPKGLTPGVLSLHAVVSAATDRKGGKTVNS